MNKMEKFLVDNTKDIQTVCELGAGLFGNFDRYKCERRIGIELVKSYIDNMLAHPTMMTKAIHGSALDFEKLLGDEPVDAFACIDFIEHLDKDVAIDLIKRMQKRANRVFIFTPYGECHQDGVVSWAFCIPRLEMRMQKDKELAINTQTHRSTWYTSDLEELGFVVDHDTTFVTAVEPWHDVGADGGSVLWAVWNKPTQ